jgi:hypothetical protein
VPGQIAEQSALEADFQLLLDESFVKHFCAKSAGDHPAGLLGSALSVLEELVLHHPHPEEILAVSNVFEPILLTLAKWMAARSSLQLKDPLIARSKRPVQGLVLAIWTVLEKNPRLATILFARRVRKEPGKMDVDFNPVLVNIPLVGATFSEDIGARARDSLLIAASLRHPDIEAMLLGEMAPPVASVRGPLAERLVVASRTCLVRICESAVSADKITESPSLRVLCDLFEFSSRLVGLVSHDPALSARDQLAKTLCVSIFADDLPTFMLAGRLRSVTARKAAPHIVAAVVSECLLCSILPSSPLFPLATDALCSSILTKDERCTGEVLCARASLADEFSPALTRILTTLLTARAPWVEGAVQAMLPPSTTDIDRAISSCGDEHDPIDPEDALNCPAIASLLVAPELSARWSQASDKDAYKASAISSMLPLLTQHLLGGIESLPEAPSAQQKAFGAALVRCVTSRVGRLLTETEEGALATTGLVKALLQVGSGPARARLLWGGKDEPGIIVAAQQLAKSVKKFSRQREGFELAVLQFRREWGAALDPLEMRALDDATDAEQVEVETLLAQSSSRQLVKAAVVVFEFLKELGSLLSALAAVETHLDDVLPDGAPPRVLAMSE